MSMCYLSHAPRASVLLTSGSSRGPRELRRSEMRGKPYLRCSSLQSCCIVRTINVYPSFSTCSTSHTVQATIQSNTNRTKRARARGLLQALVWRTPASSHSPGSRIKVTCVTSGPMHLGA
jgi:hypothetical protein